MFIKFRGELKGNHVHFNVFAGPFDGNLAHCGTLVMNQNEFLGFKEVLMDGVDPQGDVAVAFEILEEQLP